MLAVPFVLWLILADFDGHQQWAALGYAIAATTDSVDGFLARRQNWVSVTGAFLDPLADKFLVLGAMVCLVRIQQFSWVPVALIAAREIAMSIYRAVVAGRSGVSIPASRSAKLKTVVQDFAVAFAVWPGIGDDHPGVARTVLWLAVALTLYTGAEYLKDASRTHAM